jgi:hypothetical protein
MATKQERAVKNSIDRNPDIRLVREIAARALEIESRETPVHTGMATDTVAQPTSAQSPVPPEMPC